MGTISITLDAQGALQLTSDFDQANTALLLARANLIVVGQQAPEPGVRPATAAEAELAKLLENRRNGVPRG